MESGTKLKYKNEKSTSAAGELFFTAFVTICTQIMNGIVNEIENENEKSPPQAKFFYSICHNLHTNNEWNRERNLNTITRKVRRRRNFLQHMSQSQTYN